MNVMSEHTKSQTKNYYYLKDNNVHLTNEHFVQLERKNEIFIIK